MSVLDRWPSTQVKHITGWALVISTGVFTFAALWSNKSVSEVIYGAWLAFVAAYDGITAYQFKAKRETAWAPPVTASEVTKPSDSGQPAEPAIVTALERQIDATRHPTDTMGEEGE